MKISSHCIFFYKTVISPRLATYFGKKGYSMLPRDAVNYTTNVITQVLTRRRQHLERRNDFIQMMVDHEEETGHEEPTNQQMNEQQQWGAQKKSMNQII
jgi:hypothetical protein